MRIAYVVSRYPAVSHTFIMGEVKALRELGASVQTFTIRRPSVRELLSKRDHAESGRTVSILPVGPFRCIRSHTTIVLAHIHSYVRTLWLAMRLRPPGLRAAVWQLFYFAEAAILAAELRQRNIKHIHAHFANVASEVTMLASQMLGISWSMTLHGLSDFENASSRGLTEKIRSAAFVICVSDFGRAQAMRLSPYDDWGKIHRIYCGLDTQRFFPRTGRHDTSDARRIELLTVARLGPEKGHAILLRALHRVLEHGTNVRCTLVGDGPERWHLERLVQEFGLAERVVFAGAVGQRDILTYYDSADFFVLPSFTEGLPVVLMEAMAKGLPVIATRIMGIPELVDDGINGLLVPPGREDLLAAAIQRLAGDSALRCEMGSSGRAKVCRNFDVRATCEHLWQVFQKALSVARTDAGTSVRLPVVEPGRV